ncbi:MAG: DUF6913 domain-containing protein [Chitinophagales bacterium]
MSFLEKIKSFFYNFSLNKKVKSTANIQREMINIQDAKNIGVLYNASNPKDVMVVSQFAEKLKQEGKQVFVLGFHNVKSKEDLGEKIFEKSSVNFFGIPATPKIDGFQKIKLDILICAFKDECLPLEYIAATSKATFRVGAFSKNKINFYELMVNIDAKENLHYLLQQILHFLKVINKNGK